MWTVYAWTGPVGERTLKNYGKLSYFSALRKRDELNEKGTPIVAVVKWGRKYV